MAVMRGAAAYSHQRVAPTRTAGVRRLSIRIRWLSPESTVPSDALLGDCCTVRSHERSPCYWIVWNATIHAQLHVCVDDNAAWSARVLIRINFGEGRQDSYEVASAWGSMRYAVFTRVRRRRVPSVTFAGAQDRCKCGTRRGEGHANWGCFASQGRIMPLMVTSAMAYEASRPRQG